MSNTLILL